MIESWIDAVAKVFEIDDGHFGQVRSYHIFDRAELPEALSEFPCAISYIQGMRPVYSAGGLSYIAWSGVTEFHLTSDTQKSHIPYVMRFFGRVLAAVAGNARLDGAPVKHFIVPQEENALQFFTGAFGSAPEHYGILAHWEVTEDVSATLTVAP